MPPLVTYQLDGREPTTERGRIEREARACRVGGDARCLERRVVEVRYNVVRSSAPHRVETVRRLGDYLPSGLLGGGDGDRSTC